MKHIKIAARGLEFEALSDGPEEGDLIILLHGLPRNCWEWHHQIPPMAELGFHVVAPDLRGFCVARDHSALSHTTSRNMLTMSLPLWMQ